MRYFKSTYELPIIHNIMEKNLRRNIHEKEKKMDRACVRGCVFVPNQRGSCPSRRILARRPADCRGISGCDGGVHRYGII